MDVDQERRALIRLVRQRLDALRRSGLTTIPMASLPPALLKPRGDAVAARPRPSQPPVIPDRSAQPAVPPVIAEIFSPVPTAGQVASPGRSDRPSGPVPVPVARSLFGEPALPPAVPVAERATSLAVLADEVARCTKCAELAATRIQTVFGEGSPTARLMFVGEAPGADEDQSGRPFVGKSGALLTDMITKGMGLDRSEVYIANILKSRPPENRRPALEEINNCLGYLERQIAIVRPEFLCLLGATAALALLETAIPLGKLRGKWHKYRDIPTIVTYHPSYLLRTPTAKKDTWADIQILMRAMGIKPPERR